MGPLLRWNALESILVRNRGIVNQRLVTQWRLDNFEAQLFGPEMGLSIHQGGQSVTPSSQAMTATRPGNAEQRTGCNQVARLSSEMTHPRP